MSDYSKNRVQGHATIHELYLDYTHPKKKLVRITMNSSYANLYGKHRTEWVPTKTHRLITDVDATLEQQVLDLAQR